MLRFKCEHSLLHGIAIENCLQVLRLATLHNAKKVRDAALEVILSRFEDFAEDSNFMNLTAVELVEIIRDDRLNVPTEEFVVEPV